MKFYRSQPQADSHIYRSVFIEYTDKEKSTNNSESGNANKNSNNAAEPEVVSGRSTVYGTESRGDIIYFYNKIFVPKMQAFAMGFSTSSQVKTFHFIFLILITSFSSNRTICCYHHCHIHVH